MLHVPVRTQVYTSNMVSTILKRLNEDLDQDRVILSEDGSRRSPLRVRTRGTKGKATCVVLLSAIRSPDLSLDPSSCSKTLTDCDFRLHLDIDPSHLCLHSCALPCDHWSSEQSGINSFGSTEHDREIATTSAETPNVLPIVQGSGGGNVDLLMSRVEGGSIARNSCATITIVYDQGDLTLHKFQKDVEMDISHAYMWNNVANLSIFTTLSFWFMTGPVNDERVRVWLFNLYRRKFHSKGCLPQRVPIPLCAVRQL